MTNKNISKNLEYCASRKCELCQKENGSGFPNIDGRCYGMTERMYDAVAAMNALEPRLVEPTDFEKADDYNWLPAWCEERTGAGYWEMILPDALDEKDVRYWTGRPTDAQKEAVKWE